MSPVLSAKILGIHLSSDLSWNSHIEHIVSKASKRLVFLQVLKCSSLHQSSLIQVYTTCIWPVLEYGCQVWNYNFPDYLKEKTKRIQKWALQIIHPHLSYRTALNVNNLLLLSQRQNNLCKLYFKKLLNPEHKLNELVPDWCKDCIPIVCTMINKLIYLTVKLLNSRICFISSSIAVCNDSLWF